MKYLRSQQRQVLVMTVVLAFGVVGLKSLQNLGASRRRGQQARLHLLEPLKLHKLLLEVEASVVCRDSDAKFQ